MTRVFLLGAVLSFSSMCSKTTVAPAPVPVVTIPDASVPVAADSGIVTSSCLGAFNRMIELHCPAEEDARGGWLEFECPKLSGHQVNDIIAATTCVQTRQAQESQ